MRSFGRAPQISEIPHHIFNIRQESPFSEVSSFIRRRWIVLSVVGL
jgi:hypothetical protein